MSRGPTSRRWRSLWLHCGWLWGMLAGCGSAPAVHVKPSETSLESGSWREGAAEPEHWKPGSMYVIDPLPTGEPGGAVRAAALSGNGRVLALATDSGVDIFDGESLDWLGSIAAKKRSEFSNDELSVWLSPDGQFLARSEGGEVHVWDLATGALQLAPLSRDIDALGGELEVIGSSKHRFFIRRGQNGAQVEAAASLDHSAVAVSSDARFAISVSDGVPWLLVDRSDGSALALGKQDGGAAAFSSSSRYLALAATEPNPMLQLWRLPELSLEWQLPLSDAEFERPPVFDRNEAQIALVDPERRRVRLCSLAAAGCKESALPNPGARIVNVLPHGPSSFMSVSASSEVVLVPELRALPHTLPAPQRFEPWPAGEIQVRASPSLDRMVVSSGPTRLGVPLQSSVGRNVTDLTRLVEDRPSDAQIRPYAGLLLPYIERYPIGLVAYYWTEDGVRRRELGRVTSPTVGSPRTGAFMLHWLTSSPPDCAGPIGVTPLSLGIAEPREYTLRARSNPLALVPDGGGLLANTCEGLTQFAMDGSTFWNPRVLGRGVFPDRLEVPPPGKHVVAFVHGTRDDRLVIYPLDEPGDPTLDFSAPRLKYVLSENGRYLATLTSTELRLWDWAAAQVIRSWSLPPTSRLELRSVSNDGERVVAMPDDVHVWVFGPGDAIVRHPPLASAARALSADGSIALLVDTSAIRLQRARDSQVVSLVMVKLASGDVVIAAEAPGGLYSSFPSPRRLRRGGIFGGRVIPEETSLRCFLRRDLVGALFRDEPIEKAPAECAALIP